MLSPSYQNVLFGIVLYDVKGAGAMQKLARRRLDDPTRMGALKEYNELCAAVAQITAVHEEKQRKKKAERKG